MNSFKENMIQNLDRRFMASTDELKKVFSETPPDDDIDLDDEDENDEDDFDEDEDDEDSDESEKDSDDE